MRIATAEELVGLVESELAGALEGGEVLARAARHLVLAPGAKRARPRLAWQLGRQPAKSVDHGLSGPLAIGDDKRSNHGGRRESTSPSGGAYRRRDR